MKKPRCLCCGGLVIASATASAFVLNVPNQHRRPTRLAATVVEPPASEETTGRVAWHAVGTTTPRSSSSSSSSQNDALAPQTIRIEYAPPSPRYFRGDLMWIGELRSSYTRDDEPTDLDEAHVMTLPFRPSEDAAPGTTWSLDVVVPPFCQQLVFGVTDGVRFDNAGRVDRWHRIGMARFVEEDVAGARNPNLKGGDAENDAPELVIRERVAGSDEVRTVGRVERRDAGDLERAVSAEVARLKRQEEDDAPAALATAAPEMEITAEPPVRGDPPRRNLVDDFTHVDVSVSSREQRAFQEARERSSAVGASLGLSNVEIGDVRMAFERTVDDRKVSDSRLSRGNFGAFLADLGFGDVVPDGRDGDLWARHVEAHGDAAASLEQCLHIYHELDAGDEGLNLV